MKKSDFVQLLARRLGMTVTHVEAVLDRLHAARVITPETGSRRYPSDISEAEAASLLLASTAAPRLADAATVARSLMAATSADGQRFGDVLVGLFTGPPRHVGDVILRPASASIVIDGKHLVFGQADNAPARHLPGATLLAIAAELQGSRPSDADAIAAITQIRRAVFA